MPGFPYVEDGLDFLVVLLRDFCLAGVVQMLEGSGPCSLPDVKYRVDKGSPEVLVCPAEHLKSRIH